MNEYGCDMEDDERPNPRKEQNKRETKKHKSHKRLPICHGITGARSFGRSYEAVSRGFMSQVPLVGFRIARIECNRLLKVLHGAGPVVFKVSLNVCQRRASFGEVVVYFQFLLRGLLSFGDARATADTPNVASRGPMPPASPAALPRFSWFGSGNSIPPSPSNRTLVGEGKWGKFSGFASPHGGFQDLRKIVLKYRCMACKKTTPSFCKDYKHPSVQTGN